jgi:16S rRNA (uracil1498-N3)-methyltransferase
MKEQRFFYTPQPESGQLPDDEAQHALRVLRLQMGDEIHLMDGRGTFHRATITEAGGHRCRYRIMESLPQQPEWMGYIHVAVAPTKNMDRMEWLAEKATEVGMDELSLLECRFSERRVVKTERLDKILVSAMKQSHKAWKPRLNELTPFQQFIARTDLPSQRFIAHCYDPADIPVTVPDGSPSGSLPFLFDLLQSRTPALVLIGPEGDFSIDEVRAAEAAGFRSISLGTSRLRTETAALVAVHLMRLANR